MPITVLGGTKVADTTFSVANSCRCNQPDDPSMTRTLGSDGNTDKFTISMWVKRGKLGVQGYLCGASPGGDNDFHINFESDDTLRFMQNTSGSIVGKLQTNRKFRDPSAWYHLVFVWDTGNATAGNRMRMYVNGTEETSFGTDTNPSEDAEAMWLDAASPMYVMAYDTGSSPVHFDGYIAEFVCCDGQAYAASDFGEFDEDSPTIWKPKDVSGLTFGTNGWYFDFEDSSNLGNDANGGTDWSEANLAATDQTVDTPTNNFANWNPLIRGAAASFTLTEGNTFISAVSSSSHHSIYGTMAVNAGKWYWEIKAVAINSTSTRHSWGIGDVEYTVNAAPGEVGDATNGWTWDSNGGYKTGGSGGQESSDYADYETGDILSFALDCDNAKLYLGKNGTWQKSGDPTSGATGTGAISITADVTYAPGGNMRYSGNTAAINFGNPYYANSSDAADANGYGAFEYAPPSGYLALCTKNLGSDGG